MNSEIYTLDEAQKLLNSPRPDTGFAFYFFSPRHFTYLVDIHTILYLDSQSFSY